MREGGLFGTPVGLPTLHRDLGVQSGEGRVWGGEGLQQGIITQSSLPKVAIFSRRSDNMEMATILCDLQAPHGDWQPRMFLSCLFDLVFKSCSE